MNRPYTDEEKAQFRAQPELMEKVRSEIFQMAEDRLIASDLGRRLYEAATGPKRFVLVEGGSHFNTNAVGQGLYREALAQLFSLK